MDAGQTAVLASTDTSDAFKIKVGHLKPGAGAVVRLHYVTELPLAPIGDDEDELAARLTVPTTIAPR